MSEDNNPKMNPKLRMEMIEHVLDDFLNNRIDRDTAEMKLYCFGANNYQDRIVELDAYRRARAKKQPVADAHHDTYHANKPCDTE
tara:strand:- start:7 stop:261 length:255 start_codon:yes stop_codon:yes gene_type:complete